MFRKKYLRTYKKDSFARIRTCFFFLLFAIYHLLITSLLICNKWWKDTLITGSLIKLFLYNNSVEGMRGVNSLPVLKDMKKNRYQA